MEQTSDATASAWAAAPLARESGLNIHWELSGAWWKLLACIPPTDGAATGVRASASTSASLRRAGIAEMEAL